MNRIRFTRKAVRYAGLSLALTLALLISLMPMAASASSSMAPVETPAASGRYHVVKHGETLSHIARYYGVTVTAIKQANHLYGNTIYVGQHLYIPGPAPAYKTGCSRVHYVHYGETLSEIARYYGTTTHALAAANGIYNASHIRVGQKICIPNIYSSGYGYQKSYHKPTYHPQPSYHKPAYSHKKSHYGCVYVVQRGDTLSEIAKYYGVSTHYLARINGIHNPSRIYVGQRLRVC